MVLFYREIVWDEAHCEESVSWGRLWGGQGAAETSEGPKAFPAGARLAVGTCLGICKPRVDKLVCSHPQPHREP